MFLDTNAWKFYGKVVSSFSFSTRGQLHVGCPSGTPQFRVLQPDNSTQAVCASDLYFLGKVSGTLLFKNQLIINSISGSLYDLNTKKNQLSIQELFFQKKLWTWFGKQRFKNWINVKEFFFRCFIFLLPYSFHPQSLWLTMNWISCTSSGFTPK